MYKFVKSINFPTFKVNWSLMLCRYFLDTILQKKTITIKPYSTKGKEIVAKNIYPHIEEKKTETTKTERCFLNP